MLSHSGAFDMGAGTSVALWPRTWLGIVALTNAEPTGAAEALCAGFRQLLDDDRLTVNELQTRRVPVASVRIANSTSGQRRRLHARPVASAAPRCRPTHARRAVRVRGHLRQRLLWRGSIRVRRLVVDHGPWQKAGALLDNRYVLRPTSAPNGARVTPTANTAPGTTAWNPARGRQPAPDAAGSVHFGICSCFLSAIARPTWQCVACSTGRSRWSIVSTTARFRSPGFARATRLSTCSGGERRHRHQPLRRRQHRGPRGRSDRISVGARTLTSSDWAAA